MATGKGSRVGRVQKSTATLNAIRKAMPENTQALVLDMATDMGEQFAILAPRDTGSMAESTYVQARDGAYQDGKPTTVGAIEAMARALNPDVEFTPLPVPTNDTTAYVAPLAKHYEYVEFGTRYMAARPTMATAKAIVRRNMMTKHKAALERVATDGRR